MKRNRIPDTKYIVRAIQETKKKGTIWAFDYLSLSGGEKSLRSSVTPLTATLRNFGVCVPLFSLLGVPEQHWMPMPGTL